MKWDMAGVMPSVLNWLIVTLLAVTGIVFGKWFFAQYPNIWPGAGKIFAAA
jgi:hypothetical protein